MKILYEGVDIYPDISVHRCYHDMYAEKQSDELLLKLNDTRELWDSWNPKKGDTIAIEDGAAKTGKMFVESVVPESGIITLRAYSIPQSAKDKRSKSWEKVKFLQLAQEIAEPPQPDARDLRDHRPDLRLRRAEQPRRLRIFSKPLHPRGRGVSGV